MIKYFLGLSLVISTCLAAVMVYQAKQGQLVQLDLGPKFRTWHRSVGGEGQVLKACEEKDESDKCTHWSDQKGRVLTTTSKSRVFSNGSLIIYQFQKSDQGGYSSPDDEGRVVELPDGTKGATAPSLIKVEIKI